MSDFNLRDLVKDVLRSSDDADPHRVAEQVLGRIGNSDYREALRQSLGQYVRVVSDSMRGSTPEAPAVKPKGGAGPSSWKNGAAIREDWQRRLDDRIHGADGWMRVREMSSDDCLFVADYRDKLATDNASAARFWRSVDRTLDEHGVKTVGELPVEVQMSLFGGAR